MKPKIVRNNLQSLSDKDLYLFAVRPIAVEMHSGKGPAHKYVVFESLSGGERAAFMYWVLESHAPDKEQFYMWVPYMRSPEAGYWDQLKKCMSLIECTEMTLFLKKCDTVFSALEKSKAHWKAYTPDDLDDSTLEEQISKLYLEFIEIKDTTTNFIGQHIRTNPSAFFIIEEQSI